MALQRIYGDYQTAGVIVTTTGEGSPKKGTEGFAQAVTYVDGTGSAADLATETTLQLVQDDTAALVAAAEDPNAVNVFPLPDQPLSGLTAQITGTSTTAVTGMGAPGANLYNYITQITVTNTDATVGTLVNLQDGSGGTTFYTVPAPAAVSSVGVAGSVISFPTPLKQPTANTALFVACGTTSAEVIVSVTGFKAP
jgi:hypothetical protein